MPLLTKQALPLCLEGFPADRDLSSKTSSIRSALGRLPNDQTPLFPMRGEKAKGFLSRKPLATPHWVVLPDSLQRRPEVRRSRLRSVPYNTVTYGKEMEKSEKNQQRGKGLHGRLLSTGYSEHGESGR